MILDAAQISMVWARGKRQVLWAGGKDWVVNTRKTHTSSVSIRRSETLLSSVFSSNQALETGSPFAMSGVVPSRNGCWYFCASEHLGSLSAQLNNLTLIHDTDEGARTIKNKW